MNEQLWAGPDLKQEYALFHLVAMDRILGPANWSRDEIAQLASGAIVDRGQQRALYPHFDAFLAATHAIPSIIQTCFGHDDYKKLRSWWDGLSADERARRKQFEQRFVTAAAPFHAMPLSTARHLSVHRRGYPDVSVRCSGHYGIVYVGGPTQHVPTAEAPPPINPQMPVMGHAVPLELRPDDVTIDGGKPLLTVCHEYFEAAGLLIQKAREIAQQVHGSAVVTPPPDG